MILDGTLIPIDRVAADRPFYSGKHKKHGMNLQVIASPDGGILWVSGALPGSVHDKKAEWIWGVLDELEKAGLVTLADKGYQGSSWAKIPYRGKNKPESQKEANRAHAKLRAPGERANAQLKTWKILTKLRCCPWRAGKLAKAIHVLQTPRGITRMEKVQWIRIFASASAASKKASFEVRLARRFPAYGFTTVRLRRELPADKYSAEDVAHDLATEVRRAAPKVSGHNGQ